MDKTEILQIVGETRGIKAFDANQPISKEDWDYLLQVAQAAPSSNGLEAWRMIQIDSPEIRQKLIKVAPGEKQQIATAPKFVFFVGVKADENSEYARHMEQDLLGQPDEVFAQWKQRFYGLHHRLLKMSFEAWLERQATIAMSEMVFAASLIGIDSCMMEGFFYDKVEKILAEADVFDPEEEHLATAVAFGYRSVEPKRAKVRRPLSEIVKVI